MSRLRLIVALGILAAFADRLAPPLVAAPATTCCAGGVRMACCAPDSSCELRKCPPRPDAAEPVAGLPLVPAGAICLPIPAAGPRVASGGAERILEPPLDSPDPPPRA